MFLACLFSVIAACSSAGVNQERFEATYRAGKEIEAAAQTGISYDKLTELCRRLTSEVSIAKDQRLNEAEREVRLYDEAATGCRDALDIWQKTIAGQAQFMVGSNPALKRLTEDYAIAGSGRGPGFTLDGRTAVQRIMGHMAAKARAAARIYAGADTGGMPGS